jgi:5-methylcytosine-specific restriction endonuclease McrA
MCIDCGKVIYYESIRCKVCANTGKLNPLSGYFGDLNPNYKNGKPKCACGKELHYGHTKCIDCYTDNFYGSGNPNWKDGVTLIGRRIRNLKVYKEWYKACLERDNYTCQRCGSKENLEVHHKISVRKIIKDNNIKDSKMALDVPELWMLEIGITYCFNCHCFVDRARWFLSRRNKEWSK